MLSPCYFGCEFGPESFFFSNMPSPKYNTLVFVEFGFTSKIESIKMDPGPYPL